MKKNAFLLVLSVSLCFSFTACREKICDHEYDQKIVYEASYYSDGEIINTCIFCNDMITETVPKLELPIDVSITNMDTLKQEKDPLIMPDGSEIFQPPIYWIVFEMDVKNTSDNVIKNFSGQITISDHERILNVSGTFDEEIPTRQTVHLSDYGFQISHNDLTMTDNMLMGKSIEEIEAEFRLLDVNFY